MDGFLRPKMFPLGRHGYEKSHNPTSKYGPRFKQIMLRVYGSVVVFDFHQASFVGRSNIFWDSWLCMYPGWSRCIANFKMSPLGIKTQYKIAKWVGPDAGRQVE